jgi:hypothetical protein
VAACEDGEARGSERKREVERVEIRRTWKPKLREGVRDLYNVGGIGSW